MRKPPLPTDSKNFSKQYKAIGLSCLLGILSIFAILLLCAWVMSMVDLPHSAVAPLSILSIVAGCLLAGFLSARILKAGGMLCGLLCGTVIFLFVLGAELLVMGGEVGLLALYKYISCIASGMIGGILGVNQRRRIR